MYTKAHPAKPFLKWAGGKRQLLAQILPHIPDFASYIEPFVGAGAVLFSLLPQRAIISDRNRQLIQTYEAVRDDVENVIQKLEEHANRYCKEYFYLVRGQDRDGEILGKLSKTELAARCIFLNKTCFNGLYRVNSRGQFNVPFGRYAKPKICEAHTLRAVSKYFAEAELVIMQGDFAESALQAKEGDFVYFDPPYHSPGNATFTGYQAGGFAEDDQERLAQCYATLSRRNVRCLLSNADTPLIRELYKDFTCITIPAKRLINADAQGRGPVNELLIRNW
ncbi:DNA adenine methylase [Desulfovibrio sp. OttesenSCG-928-G15]|nr:DNA adenine methylase [Desulfovibrio sp. OttesenSCG-928-G15]